MMLMLTVVVSLGATAVVYEYVLPRFQPKPATQAHPTGTASPEPYAGPVPSGDYRLKATFFGDAESAPYGFELLNRVPISVKGGVASASGSEPIDEPSGTNRRTGKRTYVFSGKVDARTKRLIGTVTVTAKARDSSGSGAVADYDYRYTGKLTAPFTSLNSLKGTAVGTAQNEMRYLGPSNMAPEKTRRQVTWEFSATRL
jgi:hypothetical protein